MKMKKSKMLTYSTCALLSAGLICGGIVYNNTTAESTKVAAIGLTNIDSGTKDIMKQVQEVTTKKMLRKLHQKQKQVKKKQRKKPLKRNNKQMKQRRLWKITKLMKHKHRPLQRHNSHSQSRKARLLPSKKQEAPQPQQ